MSEDTRHRIGGREAGLAEITGADGAYIFPERLLQQIWLRGEFIQDGLRLSDGRALKILRRGRWNRLPGPDFKDAEFFIGDAAAGEFIRGDVELHLRARDWDYHGHANDAAYGGVVLHVVLFPGVGVTTTGAVGRLIPILELLPLLKRDLEAYVEEAAVERLAGRPYSQLREAVMTMSPQQLTVEVARHARARWRAKVALARRRIELLGWEAACHRRALEVLGYRPNRDAMLMVAERWPLAEWRSGSARPATILVQMADSWDKAGVRPVNSPKRRLEQYAGWIDRTPDWPDRLAELELDLARSGDAATDVDLRQRRRDAGLGDWRKRLAEDVAGGAVGGTRFDSMVCDAWLPLLAARRPEESATSGLEACWRDWWPGDSPAELIKLAREFGVGADASAVLGQGVVQGFLGWLAELLDGAGRGT